MRAWLALGAAMSIACGGRTMPLVEPADGSGVRLDRLERDSAAPDSITRDAGTDAPDDAAADAGPLVACARDLDCAGGLVCARDPASTAVDLEPLPLICRERGVGTGPTARCDGSEGCDHEICLVAGTCTVPCAGSDDCSPAWFGPYPRCDLVYARTGPEALQPVRGCFPSVVAAGASVVQHEGLRLTGGGMIDTVELGSEGSRFYVIEGGGSGPLLAWWLETRDPSPQTLFDLSSIDEWSDAPLNPVSPYDDPLVLLIPNGPRAVLSSAGYALGVEASVPTDAVLTEMGRELRGSALDVEVFYVGARGWHPTGDRGPRELRGAFAEVEAMYAGAGIGLGDVRHHDVVGGLRRRFAVIEADASGELTDLPELMKLSAGVDRSSVSLFLVRTMDGTLGKSGGIPGPWNMHGTGSSGIALAVESLDDPSAGPAISLGKLLAHELGHYLGLFHTSEYGGLVVEPLPDTPECRLDRDANGDGVLVASECIDWGAENLMFWSGSGAELSPVQNEVVGEALVLR